jgi:hypothetical protein
MRDLCSIDLRGERWHSGAPVGARSAAGGGAHLVRANLGSRSRFNVFGLWKMTLLRTCTHALPSSSELACTCSADSGPWRSADKRAATHGRALRHLREHTLQTSRDMAHFAPSELYLCLCTEPEATSVRTVLRNTAHGACLGPYEQEFKFR